jgi:hypothetical protein
MTTTACFLSDAGGFKMCEDDREVVHRSNNEPLSTDVWGLSHTVTGPGNWEEDPLPSEPGSARLDANKYGVKETHFRYS